MIREATVQKIQWGRDGNPWKILKMDDGTGWKGPVGDVSPGTLLRADCEDEPEVSRYGQTYIVKAVLGTAVRGQDAMEQWIAYRLPQVGPERAREIVARFGESLWDVLRDQARRYELCGVSGITEERADEISAAYLKYEAEQRAAVRLVELGLPMAVALRAVKLFCPFGEDIELVLQDDPYDLMDVDGGTFALVDALAQRLGVSVTDPRRAKAWVRSELEDDLDQGHCYRDRLGLVMQLTRWGMTGEQVQGLLSSARALSVRGDKVQLARIARAEQSVATTALELGGTEDVECDLPGWLDDSQMAAVLGLVGSGIAVMTGGPGCGKTTCLKVVLEALESKGHTIKLASPTGKAAKRLSEVTDHKASTIHRLLGWTKDGWTHTASNPIPASVIVIDEASMLDVELAGALFEAVAPSAQLILVGDVDQLPPVGPGQTLHDIIESGAVPVYRLTTTHRQAGDSWVIDNAKKIINGETPSLTEQLDFDFLEGATDDIVDAVVDLYRQEPSIQVLTPEHKKGAGTIVLNLAVQAALNPHGPFEDHVKCGDYRIYAGDKVLYTKNNPNLGLVNGDMGVVATVTVIGQKVVVDVQFENVQTEEAPDGLVTLEGDTARPLTLAYAMTVHKFQGSQAQNVAVVCDEAHYSLRRQLLYTGVTRTREHLVLLGSKKAIERACQRPRDTNRRTLLQERLQDGAQ